MNAADKLTRGSLPRRDFATFLKALNEDGITHTYKNGGMEWYVVVNSRSYWIRKSQIYCAWGLKSGQFRRFEIWLIHRDNKSGLIDV